MNCEQVRAADLAEKYVRGALNEADQDSFERHYFECPRCLADVEALWLLKDELQRSAAAIEAEPLAAARPRPWRTIAAVAAIAALAIIGLITWNLQRSAQRPPEMAQSPPAPAPPAALPPPVAPPPPTRAEIVATLARVDPPQYVPLTLRGPDEASISFERAMQDYMRREYAQAAVRLQRATALAPDAPHINFFLGISQLMAGRVDEGIAALQRAARAVDSDYAADAHFYLAKARLAKGDVEGAKRELKAAVDTGEAERKAEAAELLGKLDALPQ